MVSHLNLNTAIFTELTDKFSKGTSIILEVDTEKTEEWEYKGLKGRGNRPKILASSNQGESEVGFVSRFKQENPDYSDKNLFIYEIGQYSLGLAERLI